MFRSLFFFIFCFYALVTRAQVNTPPIIPQPVDIQLLAGNFTLTAKNATIGYNQVEAKSIAEELARKISIPTGFPFKVQAGSSSIQLQLTTDANLGREGYQLEVTTKNVTILASTTAGLFYGMQTLLQLMPTAIESPSMVQTNWTIPALKITDAPRFAWRGLMLDVSRHFFTKAEVKAYIDLMARYKFNVFHWHLTDDNGWRIEIKSLPKLTEIGAWRVARAGHFNSRAEPKPDEKATYGGFYTHEDIKEIVQYAQERHVRVVPEIDVPGHSMAVLAAYPELSCTKSKVYVNPGTAFSEWYGNGTFKMLVENTLNPSDEKVYEFLEKVFTEVAMLFPDEYIHVGGDECYKGYWAQDAGCQALMKKLNIRHVEDLQGYFMQRVQRIVESKGKKMIGWDEILEGGGINQTAAVMSWRGVKGGIEAAHLGHPVVMSPSAFTYLDYNQGEQTVDPPIYAALRMKKSYSFEPVPDGVDAKYILGGQGNLWTEQIPTLRYAQYMTYPRAWALAEVYWTPANKKNWENFTSRMETHFQRFDRAGINYSKAVYDAMVKTYYKEGKLMLELEGEVPNLDIYFTIDDTMPDHFSTQYKQPLELPDGPITLRVITYRNGNPIGHLITLKRAELERRAK